MNTTFNNAKRVLNSIVYCIIDTYTRTIMAPKLCHVSLPYMYMYIYKQIWHTLVEVQNNWRQYSGRLMHMLSDMDKIRYHLVVRLALSTPVAQSCLTIGRMCMECDGLHCMSWEKKPEFKHMQCHNFSGEV